MAKTQKGNKIVSVSPYKRSAPGTSRKTVSVKRHRRSTPN
jgi:hypothetical protein